MLSSFPPKSKTKNSKFQFYLEGVVPKNIHTHPMNGHWKFQEMGEGSQKEKHLKESIRTQTGITGN